MWSTAGIRILDMDELRATDLARLEHAALEYEKEVSQNGA